MHKLRGLTFRRRAFLKRLSWLDVAQPGRPGGRLSRFLDRQRSLAVETDRASRRCDEERGFRDGSAGGADVRAA